MVRVLFFPTLLNFLAILSRMKLQQLTVRTQAELGKLSLTSIQCDCLSYGCISCIWDDLCQIDTQLFLVSANKTENKVKSGAGLDDAPALPCTEVTGTDQPGQAISELATSKQDRVSVSRRWQQLMSSKRKETPLPKKKLDRVARKFRSVGKNNTLTAAPTSQKLQMLKQSCIDRFMACPASRTIGDAQL